MTYFKSFESQPSLTFIGNGLPSMSTIGARVDDVYLNLSTGEAFRCHDETFGSQVWQGSQGGIVAPFLDSSNADLLLYYDGNGALDASTYNNDGTLIGPTSLVASPTGSIDAFYFNNGGNSAGASRLEITNTINLSSNWAISLWWNNTNNSNAHAVLIGPADNINGLSSSLFSDPTTNFRVGGSGRTVPSHTQNQWIHTVVSCTAGTITIWWKGASVNSFALSTMELKTLGAKTNTGNAYTGYIWHPRVYNRPVTQEEVWLLYNEGVSNAIADYIVPNSDPYAAFESNEEQISWDENRGYYRDVNSNLDILVSLGTDHNRVKTLTATITAYQDTPSGCAGDSYVVLRYTDNTTKKIGSSDTWTQDGLNQTISRGDLSNENTTRAVINETYTITRDITKNVEGIYFSSRYYFPSNPPDRGIKDITLTFY